MWNCGHCLKAARPISSTCLPGCLRFELLARQFEDLRAGHLLVGHLPELQVGGGASPCVSEGLLGLLIETIKFKAAHTEGAFY